METQGTFNTVRFYETLAMILSKKHRKWRRLAKPVKKMIVVFAIAPAAW